MNKSTHYPSYNVMEEQDAWDDHTRSIVTSRLVREYNYQFFTVIEIEVLRAWCAQLVDDTRAELIQHVLSHIDRTLSSNQGEAQRKQNIPQAQQLIRDGIAAIDATAQRIYVDHFFKITDSDRTQIMGSISKNKAIPPEIWGTLPQKELFKKLLTLTLEAYYSHPTVWSEIGYGGPAYPRGYVRAQGGHLDPWEAQKE